MKDTPGHTGPEGTGVLLTLAYDGSGFSGFARQQNARTVAGEVEGAIRALDPRASPLRAASRTDKGVHARAQKAAFTTTSGIDPRGWALGLRPHLPRQIAVVSAERVPSDFDPRRHAIRKTYRYLLLTSRVPDPFWEQRAWRLETGLDEALMLAEAQALIGRHDFSAFRASADERADTVRTLSDIVIARLPGDPRITSVDVSGDHFLYNMVRIIVGTLVDVARCTLARGTCARVLEGGSRSDLGITAPAAGLYLETLELDTHGTSKWPAEVAIPDVITTEAAPPEVARPLD